jgi:hypothetical protein
MSTRGGAAPLVVASAAAAAAAGTEGAVAGLRSRERTSVNARATYSTLPSLKPEREMLCVLGGGWVGGSWLV